METMDQFLMRDFSISTKVAFQNLSPTLSTVQRNEVTSKVGKSIGLRIGTTLLADTFPFEWFKKSISQVINGLALGQVEEIQICMNLLRETKFLVSISCFVDGENMANPLIPHSQKNGKLDLCCFKSGLLSGLVEQYLKRKNVTNEISCGEANKGICRFEILVR